MGELDAFGGHAFAPGEPMVLLGIDERAVQVPEHGLRHTGGTPGGQTPD